MWHVERCRSRPHGSWREDADCAQHGEGGREGSRMVRCACAEQHPHPMHVASSHPLQGKTAFSAVPPCVLTSRLMCVVASRYPSVELSTVLHTFIIETCSVVQGSFSTEGKKKQRTQQGCCHCRDHIHSIVVKDCYTRYSGNIRSVPSGYFPRFSIVSCKLYCCSKD